MPKATPSQLVLWEGTGQWSALYQSGRLVYAGDHDRVQEEMLALLGIVTEHGDDFMDPAGDQNRDVLDTLEDVYANQRARKIARERLDQEIADAEARLAAARQKSEDWMITIKAEPVTDGRVPGTGDSILYMKNGIVTGTYKVVESGATTASKNGEKLDVTLRILAIMGAFIVTMFCMLLYLVGETL